MIKIEMDVSPAIINRTAVHHMVLDIGHHLAGKYDLELSVLGKIQARGQTPEGWLATLDQKKREVLTRRIMESARQTRRYNGTPPMQAIKRNGRTKLYLDALFTPDKTGPSPTDIVVVHDLTPMTHPHWHNPTIAGSYTQSFLRMAASGCIIISDSLSTTAELRFQLGVDPDRIHTLPLYLRQQQAKATPNEEQKEKNRFFLFVGSLELRKNVTGLIQAFAATQLHKDGFSLQIVGMNGNGSEIIKAEAERTPGVQLHGFVSERKLAELYASCDAFAYPSFWEGFGMPLLEAMAKGCLCISTTTGASPEVGGDAVIYVDPCDPVSIAAGMLTVRDMDADSRGLLKKLAWERASSYTLEKYLKSFTSVIQKHAA